MVVVEGGAIIGWLCQKDQYTLIEQSPNSRITCMQYSQNNLMRIIGNDQKNNGQIFLEILERIIGKISSKIGADLVHCIHAHLSTPICMHLTRVYQANCVDTCIYL